MSNAKCPICGAINMHLNLEETDGGYICSACGSEIQVTEYRGNGEANDVCKIGKQSRRGGFAEAAERCL